MIDPQNAQLILEANLERVKAQKVMEEIETGKVDFAAMNCDRLFETVLLATGSEALANSYRVSAIKAQTWKPR